MTQKKNIQAKSLLPHDPVLLSEVLDNMDIKNGETYLDCTFGAGGYSKAILQKANCNLVALDQDESVLKYADEVQSLFPGKFEFIQTNFADANSRLNGRKFDGIVLDLGVSSMQLDSPDRGFSFMHDGPLDMRMGSNGNSAFDFIANSCEQEIADIIYKYGEEVQSRHIAKAIIEARSNRPIKTTLELAEIVRSSMHYRKAKIDPATKTFQAIRIHVNKELESLEKFLENLEEMLLPGGRILVVSFHSLEDSIVKSFFKDHSAKKIARSKYAKEPEIIENGKWLKIITRKAVKPSSEEISRNPRSRSSRLRVACKIGGSDAS